MGAYSRGRQWIIIRTDRCVLYEDSRGDSKNDSEGVELVEDAVTQLRTLLLGEMGNGRLGRAHHALRLLHAVLQQPVCTGASVTPSVRLPLATIWLILMSATIWLCYVSVSAVDL